MITTIQYNFGESKMKQEQRNNFEKAVYHAQLAIASGKNTTTTKKGPGRKHVQGCSKGVKGAASKFDPVQIVKSMGYGI